MYHKYLILLAIIACTGCVSFGPKSLEISDTKYNNALHDETKEQLLLNLVRMRYSEQLMFVEVPSIAQAYDFRGNATSIIGVDDGFPENFQFGGSTSDLPTIFYQPRTDKEFYQALIKPLEMEKINILALNGWDAGVVMRLTASYVNDMDNGLLAGRPNPPPIDNEAFKEWARLLRQMQLEGKIEFTFSANPRRKISVPVNASTVSPQVAVAAAKDGYEFVIEGDKAQLLGPGGQSVVIRFRPDVVGTPEHAIIVEMLRMKESKEVYTLNSSPEGVLRDHTKLRDTITVSNRSPLEMMYFLSHGVNVPVDHLDCGIVTPICYNGFISDIFKVCVQHKKPHHAEVAAKYRGYWYFIPKSDTQSRYTFSLLTEIYSAQVRGGRGGNVSLFNVN